MSGRSNERGKDVYAKTIYAEARGEPENGQREVARVIRERAAQDKSYWGGKSIEGVCRQPGQFECWNGRNDIDVSDRNSYDRIRQWSDREYERELRSDRNVPDHYNNPDKEGYPDWTRNCDRKHKIGGHQFYRSKN